MPARNRIRIKKSYNQIRILWVTLGHQQGVAKTQKLLGATKGQVRYWKINTVGGICRQAFSGSLLKLIECILWNMIQINPLLSIKEILKILEICGISTN